MHVKKNNNCLKKGPKSTQNPRWRYVFVEFQDGRCFFVKLYMSLLIHRWIDLWNPLHIDINTIFLNIIISNSMGKLTPKGSRGLKM